MYRVAVNVQRSLRFNALPVHFHSSLITGERGTVVTKKSGLKQPNP